uniref:Salivary inositol polyphosphate 5-phosphatase n=1 Tax=Triatoma infestans TaxID=30076 RepID=A6YPS7_TRIIF|nr:salivary inositol polyphosphate 5-phosphatase [Triatoma infestans]
MNLKILLLFSFASLYAKYSKAAEDNPRSVYVVTWNVAEKDPPGSVKELLGQVSDSSEVNPDIVIIGLQELTMNPVQAVVNNIFKDKWSDDFNEILKSRNNYHKVYSESLLGILLKGIVKIKYKDSINKKADATTVKTGLGGMSGNKGAVILKFQLNNRWFCIVNSHLAAHDEKLQERIEDYKTINNKRVDFCNKPSDFIFWLGDLNFRLQEDVEDEKIRNWVQQRKYADLLKLDQLKINKQTKEIFTDFNEKEITFAPTFKLEKGTGTYSTKRRPAWTDRILYKSDTKKNITPTLYKSIESYKHSDHYPVQAQFDIKY